MYLKILLRHKNCSLLYFWQKENISDKIAAPEIYIKKLRVVIVNIYF